MAKRFGALQSRQQDFVTKRYRSAEAAEAKSTPPTNPAPEATAAGTAVATQLPDITKLSSLVLKSRERFLSTDGIPTNQLVLAALKTCQAAANAIHPFLTRTASRSSNTTSTASNLLSLGSDASKSGGSANAQQHPDMPAVLKQAIDAVTESAFAIVAHAPVIITPEVLELYVNVQSRLGRAETLPYVLELYASKPLPKVVDGALQYVAQNPKGADKAINAQTAEVALNTALEARNLDAALGIVECCYTTDAYVRQKLLKQALLPAAVLGATPFIVYGLSAALAAYQNTVEPGTATKVAFAAIIAYIAFTSTIGTIAKVTADDHMKRVSWAPGITLTKRWLREDERAALDKVACAWGYKETYRHGEEAGIEWESLREYLGLKGMILDRVEFMEGMN
ncbi:hypothetical protein F5X68DRAFT_140519 [Plectosphaerella plurivora]|uniref:Uncharacterized protein n=1 Tax=Plectosphaerella plurivora TaxID=936078 RepID=A0A9P8V522_9PEZI|nr:hypothetical protein F5X68DRAFT_140519 [Plectosphaerella plurivora]